ncbi:hypothetical protein C3454_14290 [Citrobacter europaeus]|nr:hypothetical protein MC47_013425 [Citrobacter freundii]ROW35643.1 hypothetical protein C3454_14290 [Citrobacter europaeus]
MLKLESACEGLNLSTLKSLNTTQNKWLFSLRKAQTMRKKLSIRKTLNDQFRQNILWARK